MLSAAALDLVDRLVTAVMTLVRAVAPTDTASALPTAAAQTLFVRLSHLIIHLIRIQNFGLRPSTAKPRDPPDPALYTAPGSPRRPTCAASLPRRRGWLLAALPDIAPPVAAEIAALLDDPALATLLALDLTLRRTLLILLRALGLDPRLPIPTPPPPPSSSADPLAPTPEHDPESAPVRSLAPENTPTSRFSYARPILLRTAYSPTHGLFSYARPILLRTAYLLRNRNELASADQKSSRFARNSLCA